MGTVAKANAAGARISAAQWLGRAAAGLALGWVWSSLLCLGWVGLAAAAYGGFDRALSQLKDESWAPVALAGFFASASASFLGGLVGPVAAARSRRFVLGSSAWVGAWGAALGLAIGLFVGWAVGQPEPGSRAWAYAALGLSVPAGLAGGWLGGRAKSRAESPMIPNGTPSKPREAFVAATIHFVGDQDGPPERELMGHLAALFKNEQSVQRAYLARVQYKNGDEYSVALCLATTSPDVQRLNECVGRLFAGFFRRDAYLDILFLSPDQEADIAKVCSAFYETLTNGRS
jgi:hypothetical protein